MRDYSADFIHTPNFDLLFADNVNTEAFFESGYFPEFRDARNYSGKLQMLSYFDDVVDNARYYNAWSADDDHYTFGFKNGNVMYVGDGVDPKTVRKNIFAEKNLRFIILDGSWGTEFWFDGTWEGLQLLQQTTGWFDLEIYEDWI